MAAPFIMTDSSGERFTLNSPNLRYSPEYRKESPMVTLSQKHIDAICHAELFFDPIFAKLESARLRKHLEDDLLSLAELKLYIHDRMSQGPKFPSLKDDKPDGPANSKSRE